MALPGLSPFWQGEVNITLKGEVTMKFKPGTMLLTRGVNDLVADNYAFAKFVNFSIRRHLAGDWGELCKEDCVTNEQALHDGGRLFSAYESEGVPKIWIITEWDRSATTVLFPDEY